MDLQGIVIRSPAETEQLLAVFGLARSAHVLSHVLRLRFRHSDAAENQQKTIALKMASENDYHHPGLSSGPTASSPPMEPIGTDVTSDVEFGFVVGRFAHAIHPLGRLGRPRGEHA